MFADLALENAPSRTCLPKTVRPFVAKRQVLAVLTPSEHQLPVAAGLSCREASRGRRRTSRAAHRQGARFIAQPLVINWCHACSCITFSRAIGSNAHRTLHRVTAPCSMRMPFEIDHPGARSHRHLAGEQLQSMAQRRQPRPGAAALSLLRGRFCRHSLTSDC